MTETRTSLIDGLQSTARLFGDEHGILYYSGYDTTAYRGYAELERTARTLGNALARRGHGIGDTVVLGIVDALGVADAAWGAMFAGMAFVPAPVTGYGAGASLVGGVQRIATGAEASLVIVDRAVQARIEASEDVIDLPVLVLEDLLAEGDAEAWVPPAVDRDTMAYLLFTSGSTGDPKGVITTHGGVLATAEVTTELFNFSKRATVVGWAPMHHIMGLAIQALYPAVTGANVVVCATELFQRRPIFWLQLISRHRGTASAAGNFAFGLCTQLATDEQVADLDLSSLDSLFSGSEPVRSETVRAFVEKFAPAGVTEEMIAPVMGMTEANLISGKFPGQPLVIRTFDRAALERGELVPTTGDGSVEWVSCGGWTSETTLVIVDPDTLAPVPDGTVGEIWVASPMVSPGYFRRPDATAETFGRTLPGYDESFMRTGDLAAILDDQLYVTGRLKEMLIVRGRNVYPQDIEAAAKAVSPAVGIGSAFELIGHPSPVGLVFEVSAEALTATGDTPESLALKVRAGLADKMGLTSVAVATVSEGMLPRTPTGKVRRQPTRAQLIAGDLAPDYAVGFAPIPASA